MENKMDTAELKDISKRLDALIYLMLNKNDGPILLKDQIKILDTLNFRPIEIASILAKTSTHISKELATIRKASKGDKNGKKKRTKNGK